MKKIFTLFTAFLLVFVNTGLTGICNEDNIENPVHEQEELMFDPVDLDLSIDEPAEKVKRFKIRVESTDKPKTTKTQGKIWDDSKIYRYHYFADEKNTRPLIAPVSSSVYIESELDDRTKVLFGQSSLSYYDGATLSFLSRTESDYDVGAKIIGSTDNFDYALGAYTDSKTLANSFGGIVSTKPQKLWQSKGEISMGAGVYTNVYSEYEKNTAGFFTKYRRGKFTVTGQLAQNSYTSEKNDINSAHLISQYRFSEHLMIRSRLIKELNTEYSQDELTLRVNPLKDTDVFNFEFSAANIYDPNTPNRQKFKFTTNIRF